jgi:hypothetical protein
MYDFVIFTDVTDTLMAYKPIGAYKCAYELRQAGYSCLVVDHLHTFTFDEITKILDLSIGSNTLAVGFSTTFLQTIKEKQSDGATVYDPMMNVDCHFFPQGKDFEIKVVAYIKSKNSSCKIVLGGVRAHANLKNKLVDYCIIGYSEISIVNLANHLSTSKPLNNSYKNLWGSVIIDDKLALTYDFKNTKFEWQDTDIINSKVLPLEISRGCIFKCKFCSYPLIGKKNLEYVRNIETLRDEMQTNYDRYGINIYYILDDTFNDNDLKLDALLEAVNQLTFKPIFWAYTRLDLLTTKNHVDKLYQIGLRGMYFGIESLNPKTAKIIGKGFDRTKQIETIRYIREKYNNDIIMHGSFIVGLPEESIESVNDTFNRLVSKDIPLHSFRFAGLWLDRDNRVNWISEFSKNYFDYGYSVLSSENDDVYGMKWTNKYMDRDKAIELANNFNQEAYITDHYQLPGQIVWALFNYGYSIEYLFNLKYKDINWNKIETEDKPNFMQNYKKQLIEKLTK